MAAINNSTAINASTSNSGGAAGGYIAAIFSAILNGSFPVPFKMERVADCKLHPIYFQLYVTVGVFLTCFLFTSFIKFNDVWFRDPTSNVKLVTRFVFAYPAMGSGALFVASIAFSFVAIPFLGIALAQGIWGGLAIIVSYTWGVTLLHNEIGNHGLAIGALVLLCIGVVGIASCEYVGAALDGRSGSSKLDEPQVSSLSKTPTPETTTSGSERATMMIKNHSHGTSSFGDMEEMGRELRVVAGEGKHLGLGFLAALGVGIAGGSTLLPAQYVDKAEQGLAILPAFGVGAMLASLTITAFTVLCMRVSGFPVPPLHLRACFVPGLVSGTLWNLSNVLAIFAISRIGFSIGQPMLQCALFFGGMWGIFVFKEMRGMAIRVFFVSGAVLLCGAALLAKSSF